MSAQSLALDHYRQRVRLSRALTRLATRLWARINPADISASWAAQLPSLLAALTAAQEAAAQQANTYIPASLAEQHIPLTDTHVVASAFAGVASDGRDLPSLLVQPVIATKQAIGAGASPSRALSSGLAALQMIVATQVADAGRVADGVGLTAQRGADGYVRMVVGKTCSRCIVLAGRWYQWNAGFDRHP